MPSSQKVMDAFIEIKAEDVFKDAIKALARQITVQQVRQMAAADIHAADVFFEELVAVAKQAHPAGLTYLVGLSDEKVLRLIDQAAPAHGAALRSDGRYAVQLASEIRGIIKMVLYGAV